MFGSPVSVCSLNEGLCSMTLQVLGGTVAKYSYKKICNQAFVVVDIEVVDIILPFFSDTSSAQHNSFFYMMSYCVIES